MAETRFLYCVSRLPQHQGWSWGKRCKLLDEPRRDERRELTHRHAGRSTGTRSGAPAPERQRIGRYRNESRTRLVEQVRRVQGTWDRTRRSTMTVAGSGS